MCQHPKTSPAKGRAGGHYSQKIQRRARRAPTLSPIEVRRNNPLRNPSQYAILTEQRTHWTCLIAEVFVRRNS